MSAAANTGVAPLLVELFTEELPPKALKRLETAFAEGIVKGLASRGLLEDGHPVEGFSTPRRLATRIGGVRAVAPDQAYTEKLMPVSVGLDKDGAATPALQKKLAAKNLAHVDVAALERESDGKAEQLVYRGVAKGLSLQAALESALKEAIAALPIPKVMSYQIADGSTVQFVRPAHGLVALHGKDIVEVSVLGLAAGRVTHGHRFQGRVDIKLGNADDYESELEREGSVVASFDGRKASIHALLREVARAAGASLGAEAEYAALLDEVTALVERPAVYAGSFDAAFLAVPPECLVLTMKQNQKYFPLFDADGKLSNRFLIVSNMLLDDPRNVVDGNERVVRPRLSDARFFFEMDRKTPLEARVPKLASVVYHNKLGSQGNRVVRVRGIAAEIQKLIPHFAMGQSENIDRAANLAKADLLTDMVGEFPELQGIMGRYYAMHEGLPQPVADAIEDHYRPRFAGDALPRDPVGLVVALADKLETLIGLFGIGQLPSGDKDPFALRRHALGVVRIIVEGNMGLELASLLKAGAQAFGALIGDPEAPLTDFIYDRFSGYLREQGFSAQEIDAVLSQRPRLAEARKRLDAVRVFAALPDAQALAAANKRIGNILKKADGVSVTAVQESLLREAAERSLYAAMSSIVSDARVQFDRGNYTDSLKMFAQLRGPVDAFFDAVMVNVDDAALRDNRLALLASLHREMNRVADISRLAA